MECYYYYLSFLSVQRFIWEAHAYYCCSTDVHEYHPQYMMVTVYCNSTQVGHVSIGCGNKKPAVLMLCKQWNHLILERVTSKTPDNHTSSKNRQSRTHKIRLHRSNILF